MKIFKLNQEGIKHFKSIAENGKVIMFDIETFEDVEFDLEEILNMEFIENPDFNPEMEDTIGKDYTGYRFVAKDDILTIDAEYILDTDTNVIDVSKKINFKKFEMPKAETVEEYIENMFIEVLSQITLFRLKKKISKREMAKRLGIKEKQYEKIENTDFKFKDLNFLIKVIQELGLKINFVIEEEYYD